MVSHNKLIAMWERKTGRTFWIERVPEVDLLKLIKEAAFPLNERTAVPLALVFVRGDQANFDVEPSFGVEATGLYSDVKCTTVDEYLDCLL